MVLLFLFLEELKEVLANMRTRCQSEVLNVSLDSLSHTLSKKTVS
jgi:hypothetical protein